MHWSTGTKEAGASQAGTWFAGASWCRASAKMAAVTPEPQEHTAGRPGSTPAASNNARSSAAGRSRPPATTCPHGVSGKPCDNGSEAVHV